MKKVGYFVPTLGNNLKWLELSLQSISQQSYQPELVVVIPIGKPELESWLLQRNYQYAYEEIPNLSNAFNVGIKYLMNSGVELVGFLGDDDILAYGSTENLAQTFDDEKIVAVFGGCTYIDENGKNFFHNKSYPVLKSLLTIIPNVLPNPGALIRTKNWADLGGYDENLKISMDLDYWLRLRKMGKFKRVEHPMSYFRWHSSSLTAGSRDESNKVAREIQRKHSKGIFIPIHILLAPVFSFIGELLLMRNMNKSKRN
jgi:GT2 family glycosyltransferase